MRIIDWSSDVCSSDLHLAVEDGEVAPLIDEASERLIAIIEACSFHDLTGQRVTQVVKTLRFIESRILAMIDIWRLEAFRDLPLPPEDDTEQREAAEQLNGPEHGCDCLSHAGIHARLAITGPRVAYGRQGGGGARIRTGSD